MKNQIVLCSLFVAFLALPGQATVVGGVVDKTLLQEKKTSTPERIEAHKKVEEDKKILEKKLENKAPPQEVHAAKQKLQKARTEKNREDVKHQLLLDSHNPAIDHE